MAVKSVTISAARQAFFDLFNSVTAHRGRKVVITSRGVAAHAVLVDEAYLKDLESAAQRLKAIETGKGAAASRFRLIGSMRLTAGGDEDPLTAVRAEANRRAKEKLSSLRDDAA